jgi:hypothetical protein
VGGQADPSLDLRVVGVAHLGEDAVDAPDQLTVREEEVLARGVVEDRPFVLVGRRARRLPAQLSDPLLDVAGVLVPVPPDLSPEQVVQAVVAPGHLGDDRLGQRWVHPASSSRFRAMKLPTTPAFARPPLWATVRTVVPTMAGRWFSPLDHMGTKNPR